MQTNRRCWCGLASFSTYGVRRKGEVSFPQMTNASISSWKIAAEVATCTVKHLINCRLLSHSMRYHVFAKLKKFIVYKEIHPSSQCTI